MAAAVIRVVNNQVSVQPFGAELITPLVGQATVAAAAAALSSATAESAAGPTYASTAAGLAATSNGEAFAVDNGDGTVTVYLNSSGSAVAQRTLATTAALAGSGGGALIKNRLSAGADLRDQSLAEFIEGTGLVMPSQFAGTDEQRLTRAVTEAGEVRNDVLGGVAWIGREEITVAAPFNLGDRAALRGVHKRGSVIKADLAHTGPFMVTAVSGEASMFDNGLSNLTLECLNVAGLGGVDSQAWQEGGGLENVLINRFRTYGVLLRDGFGGAAFCSIRGSEIFGSSSHSGATGVRCEEINALGNFVLHMTDNTISGSTGFPLTYGIDMVYDSLVATNIHFEESGSGIHLNGPGSHVLIGCTGQETVTNVVEIHEDFTGSVLMLGCTRRGATNLLKDNRVGGLGTISYDTRRIEIGAEPALALGANVAGGNFNGTLTTPNIDKSFGVSGIVKNSTGDYTISFTRAAGDANGFSFWATTNTDGGTVDHNLNGNNSVNIVNRGPASGGVAGSPTDANEIKFGVIRCA